MKDFRAKFAKAFPNTPAGMPNQYTIRANADAYVVAKALRRAGANLASNNIATQLETILAFVAGRDATFAYVSAIGLPRSFTATVHQGMKVLTPVIVREGKFRAVAGDAP